MAYNRRPRKSLTTLQRAKLFEQHHGVCYLCGHKIKVGEAWDDDHILARELGGSDDLSNRAPVHRACHKSKTARDQALIAKSNRVRARHLAGTRGRSQPAFKRKVNGIVVWRASGEPVGKSERPQ